MLRKEVWDTELILTSVVVDIETLLLCSEAVLFQVLAMEMKLAKLRDGVTLVSPEERKAVEAMYTDTINHWRKRKRMFRDVWDAITENSPKDVKEFKVL